MVIEKEREGQRKGEMEGEMEEGGRRKLVYSLYPLLLLGSLSQSYSLY